MNRALEYCIPEPGTRCRDEFGHDKDCGNFGQPPARFELPLPPADGRLRAALYAAGMVRGERSRPDGGVTLALEASSAELEALFARLGLKRPAGLTPCLAPAGFVESRAAAASDAA